MRERERERVGLFTVIWTISVDGKQLIILEFTGIKDRKRLHSAL